MVGNEISLKLSNDNYTPLEDESEDEEALEFTLDESQFSQLENGETFTLPNGVVIKGNSTEFHQVNHLMKILEFLRSQ